MLFGHNEGSIIRLQFVAFHTLHRNMCSHNFLCLPDQCSLWVHGDGVIKPHFRRASCGRNYIDFLWPFEEVQTCFFCLFLLFCDIFCSFLYLLCTSLFHFLVFFEVAFFHKKGNYQQKHTKKPGFGGAEMPSSHQPSISLLFSPLSECHFCMARATFLLLA